GEWGQTNKSRPPQVFFLELPVEGLGDLFCLDVRVAALQSHLSRLEGAPSTKDGFFPCSS
ncbi:MAG: hypothetical protein QF886_10165, partial [Planctomycetota bacterium]|nr:hypothetical protein [Planctomycetota bacterium]